MNTRTYIIAVWTMAALVPVAVPEEPANLPSSGRTSISKDNPQTANATEMGLVDTMIASIEKLPRTDRLSRLVSLLQADSKLSPPGRQKLIKQIASHMDFVSPLYGRSAPAIPLDSATKLLNEGLTREPTASDIAHSLTRIYINQRKYDLALQAIGPICSQKNPDHLALAWREWAKSKLEASERLPGGKDYVLPEFDVHFCVISGSPEAQRIATTNQLKSEVDILNNKFRGLRNVRLVNFRFKSISLYNDIKELNCDFVSLDGQSYSTDGWQAVFNKCTHVAVRDPSAINFYVFNSKSSYGASHGKRNSNRPYVLIGWERLGTKTQNAEAHEMGHAFGLDHVGVPGADRHDATNIMCSRYLGFGSGGERNLGFTEDQQAVIVYHAARTRSRLNQSDKNKTTSH